MNLPWYNHLGRVVPEDPRRPGRNVRVGMRGHEQRNILLVAVSYQWSKVVGARLGLGMVGCLELLRLDRRRW